MNGSPPTDANERTGESTPPGIERRARANQCAFDVDAAAGSAAGSTTELFGQLGGEVGQHEVGAGTLDHGELFEGDGLFNQFLALFGVRGPSWVSNPDYSLYTLVALSIWQFGSPMIIFLAGLRQIRRDVYEAAEIDGASRWQQFWKITLPLLTPVIFFNVVVQTIDAFKAFTPAFIISGGTGGPIDSTLFYTLYLYQEAFAYFRMGYASALAWILVVIIAAFTAFAFLSSRYWVHYDG